MKSSDNEKRSSQETHEEKPDKIGIVYVLTNAAMSGLVKIGKTTQNDFKIRLSQLYSTGVPVRTF